MGRPIGASRPSVAMLVAALALAAAVAGTAVAGPAATTSAVSKKKVKKIAAKQANKQIDRRAPDLSVASAETANSASTLNGLGPGQFLRSSRIQFGGPVASNTTTQTTLLSFPDLGIQVKTDGDPDADGDIRILNVNPPGGRQFEIRTGPGSTTQLAPGNNNEIGLEGPAGGDVFIFGRQSPGTGIFVSCAFSLLDAGQVSCLAIRS